MADDSEWQKLVRALRELHGTLLERARSDYERAHEVTLGAGELLKLLTTDAAFAWLRSLSELMVDLDVIHDSEPAHQAELATAIRAAVEHVLAAPKASDTATSFAQYYWPYVHSDPHVAMAHAGVKQALVAWPLSPEADAAALLHGRHRIAERARHLSDRNLSA